MCWPAFPTTPEAKLEERLLANTAVACPLQSQALPTKRLRDQRVTYWTPPQVLRTVPQLPQALNKLRRDLEKLRANAPIGERAS